MSTPLDIRLEGSRREGRPEHHVVAAKTGTRWTSYLPTWNPAPVDSRTKKDGSEPLSRQNRGANNPGVRHDRQSAAMIDSHGDEVTGFRNPWPSWVKPTRSQVWQSLQWGDDQDPCIEFAARHLEQMSGPAPSTKEYDIRLNGPRKEEAIQLLHVQKPDFAFDPQSHKARVTWLGHAGMLLQLPPLAPAGRPIRMIFDPIFSMRCSPSQSAGPIRSYPPPCQVEDLPEIDVFIMSHNHYDHLDYNTVTALWKLNKQHIRFVVPLCNKQWFIDCGVDESRVTELDWWDAAVLSPPPSGEREKLSSSLKLTCTPAQHNSGRSFDTNATLWASWYIERRGGADFDEGHRIYFGGDTGYQFHESPKWPPELPATEAERNDFDVSGVDSDSPKSKYPPCPAFPEVVDRLGPPHLLLLPVAVGATHDFLRSLTFLPDSVNPVPRHTPGITAHNHMPAWDAVRVFKLLTTSASEKDNAPVAIAMHWGTFVTEAIEVLKTLGELEWACKAHHVRFARALNQAVDSNPVFLAINHGQSVDV